MGLHFSQEEFKSRKSKVLNSMKEQNIDALLMFRQESMYWLTGYDTFGYVFFQTLILDKNGNTILLTRAPDLRQAQNTSNIEDIRIWVDKDGSNPTDDLKVILDELNLKGKKLGFSVKEMGRIILGNCTLYTNGSSYWIVLGYNSRKTNFYGFSLTKNLKRNNFDRIKIEKITKCYNPYKIFDHKKSQVLKQLIKHFNNE